MNCVSISMTLVECLANTPNNDLAAPQIILLAVSEQASYTNLVEIRQKVSGWTWGMTNVGLYDSNDFSGDQLGHWKFDDGSGNTALDSIDYNNPATLINTSVALD